MKQVPTQTVFSGAPNDGWLSGHCVCEKCRAWDHPDGEPRMFHWQRMRREHVALSDRHVTFANHLARRLKQRYPDQDYYVLILSYEHSQPIPVDAVPADYVIISSVANFFGRTHLKDRSSPRSTTHREQLAGWGKVASHLTWRPNTGSPSGWQRGLPDLSVSQTIEDLKFVAENHCLGISVRSGSRRAAAIGLTGRPTPGRQRTGLRIPPRPASCALSARTPATKTGSKYHSSISQAPSAPQ